MTSSLVPAPPVFVDGAAPTIAQLNKLAAVSGYACQSGMDMWKLAGPTAALAIKASVVTPVTFASIYVTNGVWSSSAPTLVTIQTPGVYQFNLWLSTNKSASSGDNLTVQFSLTGSVSGVLGKRTMPMGGHTSEAGYGTSLSLPLAAGDTITPQIECSSAYTLGVANLGVGTDYSGASDGASMIFGGRMLSMA